MVKITIIDNRTSLNIADNAADWTSDKSPANETAEYYEGVESVADQASNSNFEIYDTITLVDLSDVVIYHLFKDVLVDTVASGGIQMIVGDGTDRGGYITGGSDQPAFPLFNFWAMNRLDTTKLPATPVIQAGDGVPDFTQITQLGYGTIHANKSVGSIDNFFIDELSYIANGLRAVEIIGGSSGTPETFADIVGDDITDGIGVFNNPKGSDYGVFGSVGWGDDVSTESYFEDSLQQIFIDGRGMDASNMDQILLANGSATNSFVLITCQVIGLVDSSDDECRANWEFNVTDHNICKITGSLFIKAGTISCPTVDNTNKYFNNNTFVDCGLITVRTVNFEDNFIILPDTQGVIISSDSAQINGCTFDLIGGLGDKDSLVIDTAGTYNLDGTNFYGGNGSALYDINFTGSGTCTVNITNSDSAPTEANSRSTGGGTLIIVTGTVTTDVTVYDTATPPVPIENARVALFVLDNDNYFFEASVSITSFGTLATVTHTAHGMSIGDNVIISGCVEDAYNGAYQVTVNGVNEYEYTMGADPASPATGSPISTFSIFIGLTNASGIVTDSRTWGVAQDVSGWVRKSTTAPYYAQTGLTGQISTSDGLSLVAQLREN